MFLNTLELVNFRNYEFCKLNFKDSMVLLTGKNAQGKSNLIEAVYFLSTLKSKRCSNDFELIQKNKTEAFIKASVLKDCFEADLDVMLKTEGKKLLKINQQKKTRTAQFISYLKTVSFTYEDLLLLRGSPQDRRIWLDDAISQLYPSYKERLAKFNKIKLQRNNLLNSFKGNTTVSKTQTELLDAWNLQLVITGSNILSLRLKYLTEIQPLAASFQNNLTSNTENLSLTYKSTVMDMFNPLQNNIPSPEEIAAKYTKVLTENSSSEIIRGQTLIGPHRDDIIFFINDFEAVKYASQGQQRSIVLSLKLAELDFITHVTNEIPILLLDDVMAELDKHRQNYLLKSVDKAVQTIITAAEITSFETDFLKKTAVYTIDAGKIYT